MAAAAHPSNDAERAVLKVAEVCISDWKQSAGRTTEASATGDEATIFRAIVCGPPDGSFRDNDGLTPDLFNTIHAYLVGMNCWEVQPQQQWDVNVEFSVTNDALRGVSDAFAKDVCENASPASVVISTTDTLERVHLRSSTIADACTLDIVSPSGTCQGRLQLQAVRERTDRAFSLKSNAGYASICVKKSTEFVYREHFRWHYMLLASWDAPYKHRENAHLCIDNASDSGSVDMVQDLTSTAETCDASFPRPPCLQIILEVRGLERTDDALYFARSLLCKINDLFPGSTVRCTRHTL